MDFTKLDGLVPAIIQDDTSGEVLMVGFMNEEALAKTRATGYATFFSRSRQEPWMQGDTSGQHPARKGSFVDGADDTALLRVTRVRHGHGCHTGQRTCFFRKL